MKIDEIYKELLKNLDEKWCESTKEHFIKKSKQFKKDYDKKVKGLKISTLGILIVITFVNVMLIWITKIVVSIGVLIVFSELYLFFLTYDDYYSGLKKYSLMIFMS